jgi:hypothetical protein
MTESTMTNLTDWSRPRRVLTTLSSDIRAGFLSTSRHSLAILGLSVVAIFLIFAARPDLQTNASASLMGWLEKRQLQHILSQEILVEQTPASRSTATKVKYLSDDQLAVTQWLSHKYKISPEPLGALVSEAWALGERSQIAPTLILSIVAVESRFNPFASGSQGAMGLMQIEPEVHADTLSSLGGRLAAFDPLTNLRVGTRLLQSMMLQSSTIEEALRLYGTASGQTNHALYASRVLSEQQHLETLSQANHLDATSGHDVGLPSAQAGQL